jgi:hypothetical protein
MFSVLPPLLFQLVTVAPYSSTSTLSPDGSVAYNVDLGLGGGGRRGVERRRLVCAFDHGGDVERGDGGAQNGQVVVVL